MLMERNEEIMKLTGKRLLFLLLYAPAAESCPNAPIEGRTRLMKMVFLFEKELLAAFRKDTPAAEVDLPEFTAWKYGPFSHEILNDLEFLVNRGLVDRVSGTDPSPEELEEFSYWLDEGEDTFVGEYVQETFTLSPTTGLHKGMQLWKELTSNQRQMLSEFKVRFTSASLDRILEYVYKTYVEFTDQSVIKDRYL